jgi:hypothetical protein
MYLFFELRQILAIIISSLQYCQALKNLKFWPHLIFKMN